MVKVSIFFFMKELFCVYSFHIIVIRFYLLPGSNAGKIAHKLMKVFLIFPGLKRNIFFKKNRNIFVKLK